MSPATLALIVALVEEAIKEYPAIAAELSGIFNKPNPTPEDWFALKAKIQSQSFESLAPNAAARLTP